MDIGLRITACQHVFEKLDALRAGSSCLHPWDRAEQFPIFLRGGRDISIIQKLYQKSFSEVIMCVYVVVVVNLIVDMRWL
eukprot:1159506-Pelagomonas_calceolata.AAC.13